jgi:hypothetical protein
VVQVKAACAVKRLSGCPMGSVMYKPELFLRNHQKLNADA